MKIIKTPDSINLIPILYFEICQLDGLTRPQISKLYQRKNVTTHKSCFFLEKFQHHIKTKFGLGLREYCVKFLENSWPTCPITGSQVGFKINGQGLVLSTFTVSVTKEFSEKVRKNAEKMSITRKGKGNPMFGKPAWNAGLTVEDERVKKMIEHLHSKPITEETREKMRAAMQRRLKESGPVHAMPHSEETKKKLREHAANLWATGVFKKTSSIHIKMREFLDSLELSQSFTEEFQVVYFSVDFAFPDLKLAIECDGDYFHVNPTFYPNGPETAVQRRNFGRDKAKNQFLQQNGWTIIRYWECEINAGVYKEKLECKLKEFGLLKK